MEKQYHINEGDKVILNNCKNETFEAINVNGSKCVLRYEDSKITLSNYVDSSRLTII